MTVVNFRDTAKFMEEADGAIHTFLTTTTSGNHSALAIALAAFSITWKVHEPDDAPDPGISPGGFPLGHIWTSGFDTSVELAGTREIQIIPQTRILLWEEGVDYKTAAKAVTDIAVIVAAMMLQVRYAGGSLEFETHYANWLSASPGGSTPATRIELDEARGAVQVEQLYTWTHNEDQA